jgi:acyl-coenzyme A thioesterase PaaI-like protein
MPLLELPHTAGCLVCGQSNPHGLHLSLFVDSGTGAVSVDFTPRAEHIGFQGIVHGGVLATVIDEAMVWAATWAGKRFCVCAEMAVRFRQVATVGDRLTITATVDSNRPRLLQTSATVHGAVGLIASATGKYVPLPPDQHAEFVATLVNAPATANTAASLR